jgi:hypothetical protein
VSVELDRAPVRTTCEYLAESWIQHVFRDELIDRMARFEMGINSNQGFGPKTLLVVSSVDLCTDFRCVNLRKGACERFVPFYQRSIEIEYIHYTPLQLSPREISDRKLRNIVVYQQLYSIPHRKFS